MAQISLKRVRGKGGALVRGVIAAVLTTVIGVVVFALLIALFDCSDGMVRAVNQLIKLLSIGVGVLVSVKKGSERGLVRGALVGLCYMLGGVLVYALLTGQKLTLFSCLADTLMGVAAGGLMGLLRARMA